MDLDQRIAQFENMAQADPDNEMAHFSLGSAYTQAGRHSDAARAFLRATEAAPEMSKAYQLAAESFREAGDDGRAADIATTGYEIAARRGDLMPKNAMAALLRELDRPVPDVAGAAPEPEIPEGAFVCQLTGKPGTQMPSPPFKGPVGMWIQSNISAQTWQDWLGQGTKVINELRLDLSRDEDSVAYDRYMFEYLGITDDLHRELTGEPIPG